MLDLISNILVGVDFSEGSTLALRYAGQLALQTGARLHVLHADSKVPPLMPSPLAGLTIEAYTQHLKQRYEQLRAELARLIETEVTAPAAGKVQVSLLLREGDEKEVMLQAIAECHADLLVLGSHGRGAVMSMLMGSVSTFLCHHSPIPVVIVPTSGRVHAPEGRILLSGQTVTAAERRCGTPAESAPDA